MIGQRRRGGVVGDRPPVPARAAGGDPTRELERLRVLGEGCHAADRERNECEQTPSNCDPDVEHHRLRLRNPAQMCQLQALCLPVDKQGALLLAGESKLVHRFAHSGEVRVAEVVENHQRA